MPFDCWDEWKHPDKKVFDFYTDGLLSKWGFGDGDMLDCFSKEDLCEFVEKVIVPQITSHKVETYRIHTSHNPIRARTVDGIETLYPSDDRFHFQPEVISYTGEQITALLLECHKANPNS